MKTRPVEHGVEVGVGDAERLTHQIRLADDHFFRRIEPALDDTQLQGFHLRCHFRVEQRAYRFGHFGGDKVQPLYQV